MAANAEIPDQSVVRPVTNDELETYWADGVAKLPGFVNAETVASMLVALEHQLERPSEFVVMRTHHSDRCFGLESPALRAYLLDPELGRNAAAAMQSATARFYFDHLFAFEPNSPVADHYWHQDQPYWPVTGTHVVSFWLSLVACTPESAALKFVAGTQRSERFYRPNGFDGKPLDQDLGHRGDLAIDASEQFLDSAPPAFHDDPDGHGILEFSYEPGDAVMFSSKIVHSSGGNHSPDLRRIAYSARYVGDDARLTLRQGVFQDPALLPDDDEAFEIGGPMISRKWPVVAG